MSAMTAAPNVWKIDGSTDARHLKLVWDRTKYVYSAFGILLGIRDAQGAELPEGSLPPVNTAYTFTGREFDRESGLYYYRARYYDPGTGRFMQEDPFSGDTERPTTLNKFAYAGNSPLTFTDPRGLIFGIDDLLFIGICMAIGGTIQGLSNLSKHGWEWGEGGENFWGSFAAGALKGLAIGSAIIGWSRLAQVLLNFEHPNLIQLFLSDKAKIGMAFVYQPTLLAEGLAGLLSVPAWIGMFDDHAAWEKGFAHFFLIMGALSNAATSIISFKAGTESGLIGNWLVGGVRPLLMLKHFALMYTSLVPYFASTSNENLRW